MLDFADLIALNKFDKRGALDALRDVQKQYQRNHQRWTEDPATMPVFGTIASQFNDPGMNRLYKSVIEKIVAKTGAPLATQMVASREQSEKIYIIPPHRTRYLREITDSIRNYDQWVGEQSELAHKLYALRETINTLKGQAKPGQPEADLETTIQTLEGSFAAIERKLDGENKHLLEVWDNKVQRYKNAEYVYQVRGKDIRVKTHTESLSHLQIPKISSTYKGWGDILR